MTDGHSLFPTQLDPRQSPRPHGTFQRETPTGDDYRGGPRPVMNPYFGSHDTQNESARSDPRRYTAHVPPHSRRPNEVDVAYELDDEAHLPQGGQIVSPCHWDWRQVAHTAGHSPLDAAALACQAYHGYQRGYYPLVINGGTIRSRRRLLPVVAIGIHVEVSLSTATILFCYIEGLWTHGKIDARSRGGLR